MTAKHESKIRAIVRALPAFAVLLALAFNLYLPVSAKAQDDSAKKTPTGDEIMKKVRENEYSDSADAVIQMVLVDKNGKKQVRRFRIQRLFDNVLIRFLDPPDIKDTGYLILKDEKGESKVYYYLPPPTDDYREITMDDKNSAGTSFLGSDFDVTDFQIRNPEETENKYVRTDHIKTRSGSIECYVVESVPKDKDYKYSKVETWVRTDYWLPIKADFHDRDGKLVKQMKVRSYTSVGDRRIISKSEMANAETEHKTLLEIEKIEFDIAFPDDNFTVRKLTEP